MVLQRWQSVFLFIGAVLMALFCISPFASVTIDGKTVELSPGGYPVYLVLNILTSVLLFIAIFLYKNLKRQRMVTLVSMLLIAASAVTGMLILFGPASPEWEATIEAGGVIMLAVSLFMAIAACRGISRDMRTLSSYDRIR